MESVLIVSSSDKGTDEIKSLLTSTSYSNVTVALSGCEARRLCCENKYDLIIVNTPLSDEFGHIVSIEAAESSLAGVIIFVHRDIADKVSLKVQDYDIAVVEKPLIKPLFFQTLRLVSLSSRRTQKLINENMRLQAEIDEIKLINRAKCTLIQYLNMTEEQAHKYLERQAMDMRVSKKKIAQRILNAYES